MYQEIQHRHSLADLLSGLSYRCTQTDISKVQVDSLAIDSRMLRAGALFFAVEGAKDNGLRFLQDAISKGAVAAVLREGQELDESFLKANIPLVEVKDVRLFLAECAARFYGEPSNEVFCVGVSGTNGKTSISWIIANVLRKLGLGANLCGTLGISESAFGPLTFSETNNSTPDPLSIQQLLFESRKQGARAAVFEATSQGLVQKRTWGVQWNAAIFSNLTRDHLDLHGSMEEYAESKLKFYVDELAASKKDLRQKWAVLNWADPFSRTIAQRMEQARVGAKILRFDPRPQESAQREAELSAYVQSFESDVSGLKIKARVLSEDISLSSRLLGAYNVENILAALTLLFAANEELGVSREDILRALEAVPAVPGRLESVLPQDAAFSVLVDYAHTPDALEQVLRSVRPLCRGRLIVVFGCGGDRDRGKRPLMGKVAEALADLVVLTSDNPRTESPESIIREIKEGFSPGALNSGSYLLELDRRKALELSMAKAEVADVIVVAGKGHEPYQIIGDEKFDFSDQEICREIYTALKN